MALPLWISILVTFISGAFAGVIAPIIASKLHKKRWNEQKEFELKHYAFEKAIRAISLWEAEALDPNYQSERQEYKGSIRKMNCSIETGQELASSDGLIQIWFSEEVYKLYDELRYLIFIKIIWKTLQYC